MISALKKSIMTADKSENKLAMDLHMGWHMRKWTQSYVDECLTNLNNGTILYSSEAGLCCVIVISLNLYVRVTIKTISIARTVMGNILRRLGVTQQAHDATPKSKTGLQ